MKLEQQDYRLEAAAEGGFCAYLSYNSQCCAYGETPDEAVYNLQNMIDEYTDCMYLVEEFV